MMELASEYKYIDKVRGLEKRIEDLKGLLSQQTSTILSLQNESSLKSQKILELQKLSGRAAVTVDSENVYQPRMHLTSTLAGQPTSFRPKSQPTAAAESIDLAKLSEKKIVTLQEERNFWRRHFLQADEQVKELRRSLEKKEAVVSSPLKEISLNQDSEDQGNYIKNLLTENLELKEKLSKVSKSGKPGGKSAQNSDQRIEDSENAAPSRPSAAAPVNQARSPGKSANFAPKKLSAAQATTATSRPRFGPRIPQANIGNVRSQTFRNAGVRFPVRPSAPGPSAHRGARQPNIRPARPSNHQSIHPSNHPSIHPRAGARDAQEIEHLVEHNNCLLNQVFTLKQELEQRAQEINCCCNDETRGPQSHQGRSGGGGGTCSRCPRLTCRNETGVRFEEMLDTSLVHLCDHIKCLQRQVCHLQFKVNEFENTKKDLNHAENSLLKANQEVEHLSKKCDQLLEEKKDHLDTISTLSRKVDSLVGRGPEDTKIRELIEDIESQRDRYKKHVESLIHQLQTNHINPRVTSNEDLHAHHPQHYVPPQQQQQPPFVRQPGLGGQQQQAPQPDRTSQPINHPLPDLRSHQQNFGSQSQPTQRPHTTTQPHTVQRSQTSYQPQSSQRSQTTYQPQSSQRSQTTGAPQPGQQASNPSSTGQFTTSSSSKRVNFNLGDEQEEELKQTKRELQEARMEIIQLRSELMDCLALIQKPGDKGTQTSPRTPTTERLERMERFSNEERTRLLQDKNKLEEEKAKLSQEREHLKLNQLKLESEIKLLQQEKEFSERLRSSGNSATSMRSKSSPNLVQMESQTSNPTSNTASSTTSHSATGPSDHRVCRVEIENLLKKIQYLEKQLENTENALKTNQNLVSENSRRTYEQSSQILQLKQAVSQANRTGDELRLKLVKKDDLIRRLMDEKSEVNAALSTAKVQLANLEAQLTDMKEKIASLEDEKYYLERRGRSEREDLERRERIAEQSERARAQQDKEKEDLAMELTRSQADAKKVSSENSSLREEKDRLEVELEHSRLEAKEKNGEVSKLRIELQQYISEVRRIEQLLREKEDDRKKILRQYEDLTREVQEAETINRTLEMQAANLMIEVKSKQSDLEAARARADNLDSYVEEILRQNEQFRTQIISLNAKVDMLTSDLQDNRVARDSVLTDLDGVNQLAVKLNTDKVDLLHRITEQNQEVESLQTELVKLREELLAAMASLEDERHRARTLQNMVTSTQTAETRETVIKEVENMKKKEIYRMQEEEESED